MKSILYKTILIGIYIFVTTVLPLSGQYAETLYGTDEGLSHSTVLDIEQDEEGFIWVFTRNGLNRFDGFGFKEYFAEDGDQSSRINFPGRLLKDTRDRIWVECSYPAIYIIDVELDRLQLAIPMYSDISDIQESDKGDWILKNWNSIDLASEKQGRIIEYERLPFPAESRIIDHLFKLKDGTFLATSYSGLFKLTFEQDSILAEKIGIKDNLEKDFNIDMSTRFLSVNDEIYLITSNDILKTNFKRQGIITDSVYSLSPLELDFPEFGLMNGQTISAVINGRENEIFIRNLEGIYSYNVLNKTAERITVEKGTVDSSEGNYKAAIFYSKEGILWAGTNKGLLKIVIGNKPFHKFQPKDENLNDLTITNKGSIIVDSNKDLWIGGYGLRQFRKTTDGHYYQINHFLPDPSDPHSVTDIRIVPFLEDSKRRLWFASYGPNDVQWMDLDSPGKFHGTLATKYAIQTGFSLGVSNILEDPRGHILILSYEGMCWLLEPDLGEAYALTLDSARNNIYPLMANSRNDQLYLLDNFHLYKLSGEYKKRYYHTHLYPGDSLWEEHYFAGEIVPNAYPVGMKELFKLDSTNALDSRFAITESNSGIEAWVPVPNFRKILRVNLKENVENDTSSLVTTPEFRILPTEKDRFVEQSFAMIEDNSGRIWNSTADGLFCFNPETGHSFSYYMDDGLPANKFLNGACLDEDGILFLITVDGVIYFDTDSIVPDPAPEVILTDFRLFYESVEPDSGTFLPVSVSKINSIRLPHRQNFIGIGFTSLNYRNTRRMHFKYMLEGLDKDWITAGNNRLAEYPDLNPGRYTFRVIAANGNGVWNTAGTALDLRILPPFWFRWWAILIEILLAVTGLILFIRYRERELKFRAITLEKKVEEKTREILEQRQEVDEMKSRFYANISHEFRTPLTLMIGPLEDSVKREDDKVRLDKQILRIMLRNARRLQRLINQLLDISKLESGNMQLQLVRGNLSDFVRTISSSFLSLAESHNIEYKIQVSDPPGTTCFDADKVEKVINNLLSNAFKFTKDGGRVEIHLKYQEVRDDISGKLTAYLEIVDNGKGIAKDKLKHIFERFYQVSDSDTREVEGTGIGLALTKELVQLMLGEITVDSELGSGTRFNVKFPVSENCFSEKEILDVQPEVSILPEKYPEEESMDRQTSVSTPGDSRRVILVVEDNADLRNYIRVQLEPEYSVVEAKNGKTGLSKAQKVLPALVITDLMMPVMGGTELCNNLKTHQTTNHIPVIMLTAKADMESKLKGLETGADDYITKPFDARELRTRVKNLIEQRDKLRAHFRENFFQDEKTSEGNAQFRMLRVIIEFTNRNIDNPAFDVIGLAKEMAVSRAQLYRKVHDVAGVTPNELIRMIKMKEAARLLRGGELNVSQVMYQVGMKSTSHFARTFKKFYGVNPGEYGK